MPSTVSATRKARHERSWRASASSVDLTATIGYYAMIACAPNAFAIEPTPGEPPLEV
jgi:hypothetical protein